ncbi:MAG: hypothetical protein HC810_00535 [Acaryochloridaceae cyanobacterium RL_2_7]|nr:hypothetical protein [Acaryochloridaceae cyanobacterium RL_2_7]
MQVTSIRFERELIERLKEMAGKQGYQALVRDVLWDFVKNAQGRVERSQIRTVVEAIAVRDESCALTGQPIPKGQKLFMGLLTDERWVPLRPQRSRDEA